MYEFKVDLNGDAIEDLTYRLTFKERDQQGKQSYTVRRLTGWDAVNPHAAGGVAAKGETEKAVTTPTGLCVWTGKAGDPFWIEPDVLHAVGHAFQDGTTINLSGRDPSRAKNLFARQTVHSIVLEVPDAELLAEAKNNRRIGVWAGCGSAGYRRRRMAFHQSDRPSDDPPAVHPIQRRSRQPSECWAPSR
jgi:hypothetical protein